MNNDNKNEPKNTREKENYFKYEKEMVKICHIRPKPDIY